MSYKVKVCTRPCSIHLAVPHPFGCAQPCHHLRSLGHVPRKVSCWAGLNKCLFSIPLGTESHRFAFMGWKGNNGPLKYFLKYTYTAPPFVRMVAQDLSFPTSIRWAYYIDDTTSTRKTCLCCRHPAGFAGASVRGQEVSHRKFKGTSIKFLKFVWLDKTCHCPRSCD